MAFDPEKFVDGLHDYLARALAPLAARIKSQDERIAILESKATLAALFGADDEEPPDAK